MTEPYTAVDIAWLAAEEEAAEEPDPRTLRLIATVREERRSRRFWQEAHDTACSVMDERKASIARLNAEVARLREACEAARETILDMTRAEPAAVFGETIDALDAALAPQEVTR